MVSKLKSSRVFLLSVPSLLCLGVFTLYLSGCGKKCQPPPEQPFRTFADQEWRLAETTNPALQPRVNNFSFLILVLRRNFVIDFYKVENNQRLDAPVLTGRYIVQPDSQTIVADIGVPPPQDPNQPAPNPPLPPTKTQRVVYSYSLDTEFNLDEAGTGYHYRYVDSRGTIFPDNDCSF